MKKLMISTALSLALALPAEEESCGKASLSASFWMMIFVLTRISNVRMSLTVLVLLAVPYAHTAWFPANLGKDTSCHCCCLCCQADLQETAGIGGRCGCDMSQSEPLPELPPATVNSQFETSQTVVSVETGEKPFEFIKPVSRPSADMVVLDDSGPPLYLVNASLLI